MIENGLKIAALPIFAYLLGSVPWGMIFTRLFTSKDITAIGSGNIGATNVRRTAGTFFGVLTLIGDVVKGALPVWLAISFAGSDSIWSQLYISCVAAASFLGHLYPVYLKFKHGGKGVATAGGCFLMISPAATMVSILVFILVVCMFSRASAASLIAFIALPIAIWEATHSSIFTATSVIIALLVFIRHKENIQRLISGTEPTL